MARLTKRWWLFSFRDQLRILAHSRSADTWLGILSALESIIFPIPIDLMLWPLVGMRPKRWRYYFLLTTLASVAGALIGYLIGQELWHLLGEDIVRIYNLETEIEEVTTFMRERVFWGVFIGAFTPIPYKVFTLGAGIISAPLVPFIVASFIGRGLRYGIASFLIARFGEYMGHVIFRYLNIILSVAVVVALILLIVLL